VLAQLNYFVGFVASTSKGTIMSELEQFMLCLLIATVFVKLFFWSIKPEKKRWKTIEELREENRRERQSPKYKAMRITVLKRDKFRCVIPDCKTYLTDTYVEVDHIYPFAYFPEYRYEMWNLRTLCLPHHKQTETYKSGARKLYGKIDYSSYNL
jgi:5-methylcytosine-specific restriction endonuclease McrA